MADTHFTARGLQDSFAAAAAASATGGPLPAHSPQCLGCGPDNPHGHHLEVRRDKDRVLARHVFDTRHVGGPDVAHGGAVAAVLDDLCGFVLYVVGQLAVTRNLSVDYFAPARLNIPYDLSGWLAYRQGRKLFLRTQGHDPDGRLAFSSDAVFLAVTAEHFARANAQNGLFGKHNDPATETSGRDLPGNP